jgi:hypothetical protein
MASNLKLISMAIAFAATALLFVTPQAQGITQHNSSTKV